MEPESKLSAIADVDRSPVHSGGPSKAKYDLKQFASIEILPTQVIQAPPLSELFAEGTEIYLPLLHGDDLHLSNCSQENTGWRYGCNTSPCSTLSSLGKPTG